MKTAERVEARRLRKDEGRSIKEIARFVGVSQSTVSVWVRDIELTEAQHAALLVQDPSRNGRRNGWAANIERGRLRRRTFQLAGRRRIATYDPLYVAGCMLYWAEGAKGRNAVELSNADPRSFTSSDASCACASASRTRGCASPATCSQITSRSSGMWSSSGWMSSVCRRRASASRW